MKKSYWYCAAGLIVGAITGYLLDLATGQQGVCVTLGAGMGAGIGCSLDQLQAERSAG